MANIIIKDFEHFNKSFRAWNTPKGKYIRNKKEYIDTMKRQGMIPHEQAQEIAKKKQILRPYVPSKNLRDLANSIKDRADKKGNVKLSDRQIDAMKEMGMNFDKKPEGFGPEGDKNA
jgi:hypothetical protein